MREKEVEKSIIKYIRATGGRCQKVHSGKARNIYKGKKYCINLADKGTPDILACMEGCFIGIEIKKDRKEVEKRLLQKTDRDKDQMTQGRSIEKAGGIFIVCYSVEDFKNDLSNMFDIV